MVGLYQKSKIIRRLLPDMFRHPLINYNYVLKWDRGIPTSRDEGRTTFDTDACTLEFNID